MSAPEFESIDRLFRPLTDGAPEALGLSDDAAVIPSRPGYDLIVSKDMMVAGVHFLPDDPLDLVARKLLRVNLSDLAAMGAEPDGYFLACAWPSTCGWREREAFVSGLRADQDQFGLRLLGGDTVSTPGPLTLSATILGWVPDGTAVSRGGARPGDRILVSGTIGDGWLGLLAARGELEDSLGAEQARAMADRYRTPEPRNALAALLRTHATAAADVSDGLVADLDHIARASGVSVSLRLEDIPLSAGGLAYVTAKDAASAAMRLATGGDDYEIVCTVPPAAVADMIASASAMGIRLTEVGEVSAGQGTVVLHRGATQSMDRMGWTHP